MFIEDPLHEAPAPMATPEGHQVKPVEEALDALHEHAHWSPDHREMIDAVLADSGVEVAWVEGAGGRHDIADRRTEAADILQTDVTARSQRTTEIYETANEHLEGYKQELVEGLARYGRSLGVDREDLADILTTRIKGIQEVGVDEPVAQGRSGRRIYGSAEFENEGGGLTLHVDDTIADAETLGISVESAIRRNTLHELMHADSYRAKSDRLDWTVRTGLGAMPEIEGTDGLRNWTGQLLLDEGAQEDIRWRHLDHSEPSYKRSIMFWGAMTALDPSLERARFEAKFLGEGRGALVGRIESILGPGAIEELEAQLREPVKGDMYASWKDTLVGMIDMPAAGTATQQQETVAAQDKARSVMDELQEAMNVPAELSFPPEHVSHFNDFRQRLGDAKERLGLGDQHDTEATDLQPEQAYTRELQRQLEGVFGAVGSAEARDPRSARALRIAVSAVGLGASVHGHAPGMQEGLRAQLRRARPFAARRETDLFNTFRRQVTIIMKSDTTDTEKASRFQATLASAMDTLGQPQEGAEGYSDTVRLAIEAYALGSAPNAVTQEAVSQQIAEDYLLG